MKYYASVLLVVLFLAGSAQALKVFKDKDEAQVEMEKMYSTEEDTVPSQDWRNDYTSIAKFMETLIAHPREKVFVIYTDERQMDAVKMLCAFLVRKRGAPSALAHPWRYCVFPVKLSQVRMENIRQYKAFLLGNPGSIPFLGRMAKKGKISVTSAKAQYRLFARPNCLAIACDKQAMYLELMRVFLRSFPDFDDECYSYFYMN
jgi:hypothetical protein